MLADQVAKKEKNARLTSPIGHARAVPIGVLTGSVLSALLAAVVLRIRNRHYSRLEAEQDRDAEGVPDIYESGEPRR